MMIMADRDAPVRTELSDLVKDQRAKLRLSLRAVQDRTIDPLTGTPVVKYGWIRKLENNTPDLTTPGEAELRALAGALELPYAKVGDAAATQFFGIQRVYNMSGDVRVLVDRAESMSPDQIAQLRRMMDIVMPPEEGQQ